LPLINVQERAGGPELVGRNHEMAASGEIRIEYIYTIRISVSSINLDAKSISYKFRRLQQTEELRLVSNFLDGHPKKLALHTLHDKRCLVHVF
jgi:hypothetical protein